jgi:hypothetical protein
VLAGGRGDAFGRAITAIEGLVGLGRFGAKHVHVGEGRTADGVMSPKGSFACQYLGSYGCFATMSSWTVWMLK